MIKSLLRFTRSPWGAAAAGAGLLSLVATIPFLRVSHQPSSEYAIEAWMTSSQRGHVQVYYDEANAFCEPESVSLPLEKSAVEQPFRLALPNGVFTALRFDPIDRDGTVTIARARIVDHAGRTVRDVPLSSFHAAHQIQSLTERAGRLEVIVVPGSDDPQLIVPFDPPLRLATDWGSVAADWARHAAVVFAALLVLAAAARLAGLGAVPRAAARALRARPRLSLAVVAAVASIASAWPVVFLGRSYVSPNLGTPLLYDEFPTLPGYRDATVANVHGSDIGSTMWGFLAYASDQHRALLHDGEIPVWNRWSCAGVPLLAQGYSMLGDPLHLIPVAADSAAWAWDLRFLAAKALFALGAGLLVLAATGSAPAAAIVSLAAPFLGFFLYRLNHPAVFSFCYAPWPLYCWIRLAQARGSRAVAGWCAGLVAANFALMNTGTVKEAYMLILTMNFSGACVLAAAALPWRARAARMGAAAAAGAVFALLAAPIAVPFLDALRVAYTSYNVPSAYQIQPGMILGAFDEAFYRPLSRGAIVFNPAANFLVLAGLLYFLATLRNHAGNRVIAALAASSLLPLGMAFGLVPPSWIERIPFLANVAHIDNSFSCGLIVLWLVLAGAGFAAAARRLGTRDGRGDLAVAALLLFAVVFAYIAFGQAEHRAVMGPGTTFSVLRPGESIAVAPFVWGYLAALLAATAALGLIARRALAAGRLTGLQAAGLATCALVFLWRQGVQPAAAGFEDYTVRLGPRVNFRAPSGAVRFVQDSQRAEPGRSVGLQGNLFPGWTGFASIETISGPDPLMNPWYRELTNASPVVRLWDWRLYLSRDNLAAARPFLDFLNVRHYLDLRSDQAALGAVLKLERTGDLDVYGSPTAWPRAFYCDRLGVYPGPEELVRRIAGADGRPFAAVQARDLAAHPGLGPLVAEGGGRPAVPATDYRLTEDTTSFSILAPGPGVIVLTEAWWPGYPHARIDGRETPVFRVNHAFQGMLVDSAGPHRVTVAYRPRRFGLLLGGAAAGLAGAGLVVGFVIARGGRKPGGEDNLDRNPTKSLIDGP